MNTFVMCFTWACVGFVTAAFCWSFSVKSQNAHLYRLALGALLVIEVANAVGATK